MYAMLGEIVFEPLASPLSETVRQAYDYAEHALIEGKPDLQFIGEGLVERQISMRFHCSFCDPAAALAVLRAAAAPPPRARDLIMGNGDAYAHQGTYVITEIGQTLEKAAPDGSLVSITVDVTLREYVVVRYVDVATPGVRQ